VRSRLVIPAAILVAVAYVKGRQDGRPITSAARPVAPPADPAPGPTHASILRAEAEAADAWEVGLDEHADAGLAVAEAAAALAEAPVAERAPAAEAVSPQPLWIPDLDVVPPPEAPPPVTVSPVPAWEPDPLTLAEWLGTPAGAAPRVVASGRFVLGGWAVQAGHMAVCGVTFPSRVAGDVEAARIRLVPDALRNVSAAGLVVLGDAGFAPDGEGFTLMVAAVGPGAFAASGRYELIAGSAG
jgi:hypothetical protein